MRWYKIVIGGYIMGVGTGGGGIEISESEYNEIIDCLQTKPVSIENVGYRLKENLTWESFEIELPDEPSFEDKAEAYDILIGESEQWQSS